MEQEQAKRIIEALLFASEKPLTVAQMKEVLDGLDAQAIKALISQLQDEYTDSGRSFSVVEVAGGYRVSTDPEYAPWLKKLYKSRTEKVSLPSLETLAIVAYRQPITRLEIENIRGVNVDGVLRTLLGMSLVRISGRKEILGRPFLYRTTREFLEFFGLQSLEELPKLEEFGEVGLAIQKSGTSADISGGKENEEVEEISQENSPLSIIEDCKF